MSVEVSRSEKNPVSGNHWAGTLLQCGFENQEIQSNTKQFMTANIMTRKLIGAYPIN